MRRLASLLVKLNRKNPLFVVCGGGAPARAYADAVRELGGNEFLADEAAIMATRTNAFLMMTALGEHAYPNVLLDFVGAAEASISGRIPVMGGTIPGFSTDADAALVAEKIGARRLVNLSIVDAIYSADPRKVPGAKKFDRMTHQQLVELASASDQRRAGTTFVFDVVACKILARSKLEAHFVNGRDLAQVASAVEGRKHKGTVVSAL